MNLLAVLEGLLFVVGDDGVSLEQICEVLNVHEEEAKKLLLELKEEYKKEARGINVCFLGNRFKLTTKKEHKEYYQKLITFRDNNLSQSQLEVLAVIAYNEPITRIEIDEIRGIGSSYIIKKLISKDLIRVCGKSDLPGKPNLYKTTRDFLDCFGLASINDLPSIVCETNNEEKKLFAKTSEIDKLL